VWPFADINPDGSFPAKAQDWKGSNHGTPANMAAATVNGTNGVAVFNGSSSYIALPDSASPGTNAFTISIWVRQRSGDIDTQGTIFSDYGAEINNHVWIRSSKTRHLDYRVRDNDLTAVTFTSDAVTSVEEWRHTVLTRSGPIVCAYINGTMINCQTNAALGPVILAGGDIPQIGSWVLGPNPRGIYSNADMDEIAIFPNALSSNEVHQLYLETKDMFP
jgi:hypothetical protein